MTRIMKCPKCNQEVTGKYCSFCGALLQPDPANDISDLQKTSERSGLFGKSSNVSDKQTNSANPKTTKQTVTQETTVQKKKKKKKKGRVSGVVSGSLSTAGSVTTGSIRTIWKIVMAAIQWITAAVMLLITWKLFQGFWAQRTDLGSLTGFIQEKNVNQAAYLTLSLCLVAFGILQTLWIISRKKMPDNGKVRRLDMGRGTFGFLAFLLLALIAQYINPIIPEHPYPLLGVKQVLSVVNGLGKSFMMLTVAGIVLCIVRKVGTR